MNNCYRRPAYGKLTSFSLPVTERIWSSYASSLCCAYGLEAERLLLVTGKREPVFYFELVSHASTIVLHPDLSRTLHKEGQASEARIIDALWATELPSRKCIEYSRQIHEFSFGN